MSSVCSRCALRLSNARNHKLYSQPSPPTAQPCPLCLGILQDSVLSKLSSALSPQLASLTHNSRIKINTALPISASVLRDRAHRLHLSQTSSSTSRSRAAAERYHHVSLREAVKWTLCDQLRVNHNLEYSPQAQLFLDLTFTHPETDCDSAFVRKAKQSHTSPKRPRVSESSQRGPVPTSVATRTIESMSDDRFIQAVGPNFLPPPPVTTEADIHVSVSVAPVLLAASYNKLSRVISQTPWFVDAPLSQARGLAAAVPSAEPAQPAEERETDAHGRRKRTAISVEEVATAGICAVLRPEKATFTAGGREDVDVRMLGRGRPFVVEVINPCVIPDLITPGMVRRMATLSGAESKSILLNDLRIVSKDYFSQMRTYESEKRKCYRCVVWTSRECTRAELVERLEVDGGFMLKQKTPLRVLHRRTQMVRKKQIFETKVASIVSSNFFVLDVIAAAGTYIKEFVHGDNGRTVPNVAGLLNCDADILQLDVTDIHTGASKPREHK